MPDRVELDVQKILNGEPLTDADSEICDFTLAEQNAAMEAQGVEPTVQSEYQPVLGANVTYVVAAVLVNDQHEVLMIQEAKESCAGKWYLPAGRMEKGESICAAAKREVLEETGLEMVCTTLLMVECAGGSWVRFILTGNVVGGELKTPAQADQESLQAKWVANLNELSLRSNDILPLIGRARYFMKKQIKLN